MNIDILDVSSASKDSASSGRNMRGESLYRRGYGDTAEKSEETEDFAFYIGLQQARTPMTTLLVSSRQLVRMPSG